MAAATSVLLLALARLTHSGRVPDRHLEWILVGTISVVVLGALNRRAWDAELLRLQATCLISGALLAIALIDFDHFKEYNDRYGHSAGDRLLSSFADAARESLRDGDVFARWGGEEFIVALPDCSAERADVILRRVADGMQNDRTCSIGRTVWNPNELMVDCIARADAALYEAKANGRDQIMPL